MRSILDNIIETAALAVILDLGIVPDDGSVRAVNQGVESVTAQWREEGEEKELKLCRS